MSFDDDAGPWRRGGLVGADVKVVEEVGRFALHELIGRGGAAEVWRATDRRTARVVALKLLFARVAEDEASRERFLREAKHAVRVDDPHVVPIYDYDYDYDYDVDGRLYISMKLVDGPDLAQCWTRPRCPRSGP